jgi:hypothetical protein
MKFLIKFPTRGRPNKFLDTLKKYVTLMDDKSNKIIISCDIDDDTMKDWYVKDVLNTYGNVEFKFSDNKSKVEAINADLYDIDFDILLLASDDMIPIVKGYDTIIKNKMNTYYPDTDGVLWFNDGHQGNKLNTLCILGKKYYDRFGYIYNPEYKSVWCDNEFMDVPNFLNKQTYFNEVIIEHKHPDWGYGSRDNIHNLNVSNERYDKELYKVRKKNNFYL